MKTTLNEINKHHPCLSGWAKLLKGLNKSKPDNAPLGLETILAINGIEDAIWALRCFDYRDYCLFLADLAELVLPQFEDHFPDDGRPRKAIEAIRDYHAGKITREELGGADAAAYAAADAAAAAYAACAADAAAAAAYAACAAADAAYAAAYAAAAAAYAACAAADAAYAGWEEAEALFIKHFGDKTDD